MAQRRTISIVAADGFIAQCVDVTGRSDAEVALVAEELMSRAGGSIAREAGWRTEDSAEADADRAAWGEYWPS